MSDSDRPISQLHRQPVDTRVRLVVGLEDPEREHVLLPVLHALPEFVVVERCLAADQVLDCVHEGHADAALLAFDLHRLTRTVLTDLRQSRVALVVLAPDPDQEPWRSLSGVTVSLEADAATVERALTAALRGERPPTVAHDELSAPAPVPQPGPSSQSTLSVLAVAGGYGSPGRSTVALNLAAALGAVAPTALVDADLNNPSLSVHLDADPTRNLYMLAHAEPDTTREWDHALSQEVQPLAARSPYAAVLCGLHKPGLRGRLSLPFFERLLAQLRQRYRYVILDVGADLQSPDGAAHRAALTLADQTLLVIAADLVGLRQGQQVLAHFTDSLGLSRDQIALILNRHDRRHHYSRTEIE